MKYIHEWLSNKIAKIIEETGECPHQKELDGVSYCPLLSVECKYSLNERILVKNEGHESLCDKCSLGVE